ncbi:hypothetical protein AMECASPLE_029048 [Ameca splendens]|uniref:Uncharacterized protein n=1 Tax=Ameca splendens TaxID=208324 RepID=A0ABV0ZRF6_9TELE
MVNMWNLEADNLQQQKTHRSWTITDWKTLPGLMNHFSCDIKIQSKLDPTLYQAGGCGELPSPSHVILAPSFTEDYLYPSLFKLCDFSSQQSSSITKEDLQARPCFH